MAQPKTATIIRQLGLSQTLAEKVDKRAAQLGLSTPEYIRYLLMDNHPLRGQMGLYRAFSIRDDLRVVYFETPEYFLFLDMGPHDEVYYR